MNLPAAFSQPRAAAPRAAKWVRLAICIAAIVLLRGAQHYFANLPPMGGFLLAVVLAALWTMPVRSGWAVALLAIASTPAGLLNHDTGLSVVITQMGAILVVSGLTEITIRSLQKERERQEATARQLRKFAATAAHELRNPLTAIKSELETMLRNPRSMEAMTESMRRVLHNTDRLIRVNDTLLTLARSDAGVLTVGQDEVDLADLVEEACSRWRAHAENSGVELLANAEDPAKTRGDPVLLSQLLDNLISNALRYAPSGTIVEVAVDGDRLHAGRHVVSVTDSGPGIDAGLRETVFEPFVTADTRGGRRGAGLGLALCAAIAAAHSATIELNPARTVGTQVLVAMPAADAGSGKETLTKEP